ncbi:MAG TPA: membrane protein insertion efficiency factor YidD [Prolixibacteraceae bacterium]|nr:membrane protein insertion efficiency factor YidD [Prolixibacteraceae bacterium]HPR60063.1 membrane protein insertion efficiency factor YidD [Prolixibacteraceae bacterium]
MNCKLSLIFVLLFVAIVAHAQQLMNKQLLSKINQPEAKEKYVFKTGQNRNELEGTFALMFTAYKKYVSPQDMSSCVFHPSCSVYAMQAIQQENAFVAYLKIFDRLTRCHPLVKQGQYPFDPKTGLYEDPLK